MNKEAKIESPAIGDIVPADAPGMETITKKGYKTAADVVKAYSELLRHHNNGYRAPKEGASKETWREFYTQIGAPEDVDGYTVSEEWGSASDVLSNLRETALEQGLSSSQWEKLAGKAAELQNEASSAFSKKMEDYQQEWQKRAQEQYGPEFAKKLAKAEKTYTEMTKDAPEIDELLQKTNLKNHPALIDLMLKVSESVTDDKAPNTQNASGGEGPLDEGRQLAARVAELNMSDEMNNMHHPKHTLAILELQKLQARLQALGFQGATDKRLRALPKYF